jgi:uncharacterized RDD family membrane protein YckC
MSGVTSDTLTLNTVDAVDVSLPIAGVGSSGYAFIIDWHLRILLAALVALVTWLLLAPSAPSDAARWLRFMPAFAVYFLYHPVWEIFLGGRTPGKRVAKLRVVTREGAIAGAGHHAIRNILRVLDSQPVCYGLGIAIAMSNRRCARLGDLAAGTLVVFETDDDRSGMEIIAAAQIDARLALLVHELLQRWRELDAEPRQAMARQLLERAGVPPPTLADNDALHGALEALLRARPTV